MRTHVAVSTVIAVVSTFASSRAESGAEPRDRIEAAVASGRENLLVQLDRLLKAPPPDYPMGRLALAAAALLKAGVSSTHPSILSAFDELKDMPLERTYCVSCYLLALSSLVDRRYEEALLAALAAGGRGLPDRKAGGDARVRMEALVSWLVSAQDAGHGTWTYQSPRGGRRHDFSNTQFAVLGLEVALEHQIQVPHETFKRVADCFTGAQITEAVPVMVEIRRELSIEERLRATTVDPVKRYRAFPGGWAYRDGRGPGTRRSENTGGERSVPNADEPYASMTAAGASSLLIAGRGLGGPSRAPAGTEAALHAAYAWISVHFDDYIRGGKNLYYTLYSLEKVGDLGGLQKFGKHDWYGEGAGRILSLQAKNGGWGSYVNTSLALLFLTRATRIAEVSASPVILTGGREERRGDRDLVYIDRLKGFVSARALLRYAGETRRADLIPACEESVRNYPPDYAEELIPHVLLLWSRSDRLTSFAQRCLVAMTGVRSSNPEDYARWHRQLSTVKALETKESVTVAEIEAAIRTSTSPRIKARAAILAGKRGLRALQGLLIEEMSAAAPAYRRTLHDVLCLWAAPPLPAPAGDDAAAWEGVAEAWRTWWRENGGPTRDGAH